MQGFLAANWRATYSPGNFDFIGEILTPQDDPFLMITSESKRVRVWDLRTSLNQGAAQVIENPDASILPSRAY